MYDKIIILFILINAPIVLFFKKIVEKINIYDSADNVRKFHKNVLIHTNFQQGALMV